jgi:hypothetical protein
MPQNKWEEELSQRFNWEGVFGSDGEVLKQMINFIKDLRKADEQEMINIVDRNTTIGEIREEILDYYYKSN